MARLPTPSPAVRWVLTIGVVAVLLIGGFFYYSRLKDEQSSYLASIAQSNQTIETFQAVNLDELEAEIAQLQSKADNADLKYNALKAKYLNYVHSIEIEERMYEAAFEADATITQMTCDGPKNEEVGDLVLSNYVFNITAEAPVPPQLLNFIIKISNSYETGVIEWVDLSVPRPPDEGVSDEPSIVDVQLRVYYLSQEAS